MIPSYSHAAVLVSCRGAGLMTIETHRNGVEYGSSTTARDLMDILPGKLTLRLYGKPDCKAGEFAEFMIVASASNAPSCMIRAHDDEPCTTEDGCQTSTQCQSTNWVHLAQYKLPDLRDEQVDKHNGVVKLDRNANLNLTKEFKVPKEYVAYR